MTYYSLDDKEFEIFKVFRKIKSTDNVCISTYGISPMLFMSPVIKELVRAKSVTFIVGYTKATHNLVKLYNTLLEYYNGKFKIKLLPNNHIKLWLIGKNAFVGSSNFTQNTCPNIMVKTNYNYAAEIIVELYNNSIDFSRSTDLKLVRQNIPNLLGGGIKH